MAKSKLQLVSKAANKVQVLSLEPSDFDQASNLLAHYHQVGLKEEDIVRILGLHFDAFHKMGSGEENLVEKLWFSDQFMPNVLELIFEKSPQYFVDEIEDWLIHWIKNDSLLEDCFMPKVIHFVANSSLAFDKLQDILLEYAQSCNFDSKFQHLIDILRRKIFTIAPSPVDLYSSHLQEIVSLLLVDPDSKVPKTICDRVAMLWLNLCQTHVKDAQKLSVLFLPWLKLLLNNNRHINFTVQLFLHASASMSKKAVLLPLLES